MTEQIHRHADLKTMAHFRERNAILSLLTHKGAQTRCSCSLVNFAPRHLELDTDSTLEIGQLVSIEVEDILFMGEVITSCRGEKAQRYRIIIKQTLTGLQSLLRLRAALLGIEQRAYTGASSLSELVEVGVGELA